MAMIRESGMSKLDIARKARISRSTLDSWLKPENERLLTIDRITRISRATRQNPVKYLPELENEGLYLMQEPKGEYEAKKTTRLVSEYFEDIILKLDKYRDEYIRSLQHNVQLQDEVIVMLKEKLHSAGGPVSE